MKLLKTLTMCAVAATAVTVSQGAVTIRITGSTAFRTATIHAIEDILNPGFTEAYVGSSQYSAGQSIISGTTVGSNIQVTFKTSWAGSVGGVNTVVNDIVLDTWLQDSVLPGSGVVGNVTAAGNTESAMADVTMSDTFQSSTAFTSPVLVENRVGVVPFKWVIGPTNNTTAAAAVANVDNITPFIAQLILTGGAPLSMMTGNEADAGIKVYALGRDEDSGTRLTALADSGFGVFGSPIQVQPTISGGEITGISPWPENTVLGVTYDVGHSGYASGGTLASDLKNPVSATATDNGIYGESNSFVLVGYAGTNDAAKAIPPNGNGKELKYNGVAYSDENIKTGRYTFWGYEHLLYRQTLAGDQLTVANQLRDQIKNVDATYSGLLLSDMYVSRAVEGGIVTH